MLCCVKVVELIKQLKLTISHYIIKYKFNVYKFKSIKMNLMYVIVIKLLHVNS